MNQEQMNTAMESLSEWLEDPEKGLGREPIKIKCAGEFEYQELHYYIFKYKKSILGRWLLGICGGYKGEELKHCGHVYSEMEEYLEECAEEDAIEMLKRLQAKDKEQPPKDSNHKKVEEKANIETKETKETEINKSTTEKKKVAPKQELGKFVEFVLLKERKWDKAQFLKLLEEEWKIQPEEEKKADQEKQEGLVVFSYQGCTISVGLMPVPIPNGEAEHSAQSNYMWKEAVEVTKEHQAHLLVSVFGKEQNAMDAGELLVKIVTTCCKQQQVVGVYANGTVYQPEFYQEFASMMKEDMFPIYNLIWFGLYEGEKGVCAYTYGLKSFGFDEIEVIDSSAEPHKLREFMADIAMYVLQDNVVLKNGETIGFTADEKLPITKSKGIAVDGETIKIAYLPANDKISKNENPANKKPNQTVFHQDLGQKENSGTVFIMNLLMKEKCEMPDKEKITAALTKHLGEVKCFSHDKDMAGFAVNKYKVELKEGTVSPQLMLTNSVETKKDLVDEFTKRQMWDCQEERDRIFAECKYQVIATDMLAGAMEYKDRAEMLMDYLEALMEIYPKCEAIYFQTSGKMFTAEAIRTHQVPKESRFIYFAVNVRFFNIEGTKDALVDSLGMSTLNLPDLQYHFHGMNTNWVVNHAYNLLSYIYENNSPIRNGETIDGITKGNMDREVQWPCHYENSLIQPAREVIDVCMNEYAAGDRDYKKN